MEQTLNDYINGSDPKNLDNIRNDTGLTIAFTQKIMLNLDKLNTDTLAKIDADLEISKKSNCEILVGWYYAAKKLGYEVIFDQIYELLARDGRIEIITPIFKSNCRN